MDNEGKKYIKGSVTMKRAPDWTPDEFEVLLHSPTLTDDDLRLKLPNRTLSAIQIVRRGIHAFHTEKNISMLSKMMIQRLEEQPTGVICPICEMHLGTGENGQESLNQISANFCCHPD